MKRQDLIAFARDGSRHRLREVVVTLAFFFIWMAVLLFYADPILDLGVSRFIVLAAVPIVVFVAVAVRQLLAMPRCPHCGIRLVGWLLGTAVASGNCGHCGRSIEG
jgi:asparagine N-glycosylation enzyme membrane subunit Stt3